MQKKLVNYVHLFVGEGLSVAQVDAMKRRLAQLERENAQLKAAMRRIAERERENPMDVQATRH